MEVLSSSFNLHLFFFSSQVENVVKPFILSDADYEKLMGVMLDNFERGLGKETNAKADVKMFPTYVRAVPDGTGMGYIDL